MCFKPDDPLGTCTRFLLARDLEVEGTFQSVILRGIYLAIPLASRYPKIAHRIKQQPVFDYAANV